MGEKLEQAQTPFANAVRQFMAAAGLTYGALAFRLGVTLPNLYPVFRDGATPRAGTVAKYASALGVPLADLQNAIDARYDEANVKVASGIARLTYVSRDVARTKALADVINSADVLEAVEQIKHDRGSEQLKPWLRRRTDGTLVASFETTNPHAAVAYGRLAQLLDLLTSEQISNLALDELPERVKTTRAAKLVEVETRDSDPVVPPWLADG